MSGRSELTEGITAFDTWVYAKEVADRFEISEIVRNADGNYAVWIGYRIGGYWYSEEEEHADSQ